MADICPNCGLPKELCVCEVLNKEGEGKIKVYSKKAKFDKVITIIEGISTNELESVAKYLKKSLASGGTYKDNIIELQGNQTSRVKQALVNLGYKGDNIDVVAKLQ